MCQARGWASGSALHTAFAPFLVGDRACAGISTVYVEVSLAAKPNIWFSDFKQVRGSNGRIGEVAGSPSVNCVAGFQGPNVAAV